MASTIKVDTIDTPSGAGSITFSQPVAGDGNALVGISPRNFIIDGDFTQWPTGTSFTTATNNSYQSALFYRNGTATISTDVTRSTDTPTVAQSNWNSSYSFKAQCSSVQTQSGSEVESFRYCVTGSDYQGLHGQEVTLSFWVKAYQAGDWSVSFWNSATNRVYTTEYTINSSATWERKTITLTLDSSGTWLFTEADLGLRISFILNAGPDRVNSTADTWVTPTGSVGWALSGQTDFGSSTSNYWQISQVGLYLGGSAPTFTSPPIATVKDQVEYYIEQQNFDTASSERGGPIAYGNSTTTARMWLTYRKKRKVPTITLSNTDTWSTLNGPSTFNSATPSYADIGNYGCRVDTFTRSSGTHTANDIFFMNRDGTDTTFIRIDARH